MLVMSQQGGILGEMVEEVKGISIGLLAVGGQFLEIDALFG